MLLHFCIFIRILGTEYGIDRLLEGDALVDHIEGMLARTL